MTPGHGPRPPAPRFRLPLSRGRVQASVEEELRFHIEERIDGLVAAGYRREDAEREVRSQFGDYAHYVHETRRIDEAMIRERHWIDWGDALRRGVAQGLRTLLHARHFSFIAILTLALGIAATTAIYSVLDTVVLRPLPYPNPSELVSIRHPAVVPGMGESQWAVSPTGFFHFQGESRLLSGIGAHASQEATLLTDGEATRVTAVAVTASLLETLGIRTVMGRPLLPSDDRPGAESVALLSHEAWMARFGGDRAIIGRMLDVGGERARVVGVLAPRTLLPRFTTGVGAGSGGTLTAPELWFALQLDPAAPPVNSHWLQVVARLRPGTTPAELRTELARHVARFPDLYPSAYSARFLSDYRFDVLAVPLGEDLVGSTARLLWILLSAVAVVFVIAAANVANLFLVRAETRRREVAVRVALGARRAHLGVHFLAESVLLAAVAAVVALALAHVGTRSLLALAPPGLPRLADVQLTAGGVVLAVGLALAAGLAFGTFSLGRGEADVAAIRDGGRGTTISRARRRLRGAFVVGQVALALVLLAGAGLMVRSMQRLAAVRPGFDATGVLTVQLPLSRSRYRTYDEVAAVTRALVEQVRAVPGVTAVGAGTGVPLAEMAGCALAFAEGKPRDPNVEPPCVGNAVVSEGYFAALGIPVRGRALSWGDLDAGSGGIVVTRELAERFWPGEDPIGKGLRPNGDGPPDYRIVGVVEGVRADGLDRPPVETIFYPMKPIPGSPLWQPLHNPTLVVRANVASVSTLIPALRRAVAAVDPQVPLANVQTMDQVVAVSTARTRFILVLLGVAAAMAMLLSAVGLYGVVSYLVAQRRPEFGVRMALGAQRAQISRLVVREALHLAVLGVVLGLGASFAVNQLLAAFLFETPPHDPLTLGVTTCLLVMVAVVASALPARRASDVAPSEVMREG
jgi:putative ABC transport system permease protein